MVIEPSPTLAMQSRASKMTKLPVLKPSCWNA